MRHVIEDVFHVVLSQHASNPHVPNRHAHHPRRKRTGWLMTTTTIDSISFFAFRDPLLVDLAGGSGGRLRYGPRRCSSGAARCKTRSGEGKNKSESTNEVHSDGPKG